MRLRSGWFGLVALSATLAGSAALAGCGGQSVDTGSGAPEEAQGPSLAPAPEAVTPGVVAIADDATPEVWMVQLEEEPTARGGDMGRLLAEKDRFRARAVEAGLELHERYAFHNLWNGMSVRIPRSELATLATLPGVRAIYPQHIYHLDNGQPGGNGSGGVSPDLFTAITMSGADIAQNTLGLTGAKVKVGVVDTGIDYNHPDLGGCFGPGCKVAYGYDFVGDHYDANVGSALPEPDNDPHDNCNGHGTHVAGIIGANGAVKGVAPGVTLGAYRIFGCSGSAGSDVIVKAMEMAAADGMRVINMSLGSSFAWPHGPEVDAANELVKAGVVVVASIGNSGANGVWAAGQPGNGDPVIGVAAFDNIATAQPAFTINPHDTMTNGGKVGFNAAAGAPPAPFTGTLPLVRTGTVTTTNDGCNPLAAGSLTGQAVLIRRGTCGFFVKATNAVAAGASAVVLYNNQPVALNPTVAGNPAITIPVVAISGLDGAAVNAQMDAGAVTLTFGTSTVSTPNTLTPGLVSSFSSFGPTAELGFKPDLGAPGGNIYSTYPLALGTYASLSGTSMSSPHVTGTVALLLQGRPGLGVTEVRDLLMNTAVPQLWAADTSLGVPDNVHRQGAGEVRVDLAAVATVEATPSKIALGESQAGPVTTKITLTNSAATAVTFDVTHTPAMTGTGTQYAPTGANANYATVGFSKQSITVPAKSTAAVDVTITADGALAQGAIYGGYLVFTQNGGAGTPAVLRVPYMGFKGDYQSVQILTPTAQAYPWLAASNGQGGFAKVPAASTFTLQNGDVPYVVAHYDHAAREVKMDIFEATKMKPYGNAVDIDYWTQNSTPTGTSSFSSLSWNGTTVLNKQVLRVPNGSYVIKLSALKALGNANNPADWETWTSPAFTVNHP